MPKQKKKEPEGKPLRSGVTKASDSVKNTRDIGVNVCISVVANEKGRADTT